MTRDKLSSLRETFITHNIDGFLIPRADEWYGEFVSERAERLKWISNFSGSAGIGIVLKNKAAVLTDGRYTIQVKDQVDESVWETGDSTKTTYYEWLSKNATKGDNIGFDPKLHSVDDIEKAKKVLEKQNISLIEIHDNPVDSVWEDQPSMPSDPVSLFPEKLAGKKVDEKIQQVIEGFEEEGIEQFFFTMPDSIAWLLNVRGDDVTHTPVPLSYGLLKQDGKFLWFIGPDKVPQDISQKLGDKVEIHNFAEMDSILKGLNSATGLDKSRSAYYFSNVLPNAKNLDDPCIQLKACKNETEQAAIRQAHIHDGQALIEFHRWLKDHQNGKLDELKVEAKLEEFRRNNGAFQSPSFDTIAGYRVNGAIIHYRSSKETNQKIKGDGFLLIDSGAQYLADDYAGTTDVTRTYIIGEADNEMKYHYTTVLRAHIAIAKAKFPYGTTGVQIDAIARTILWQEGLDFAHGLGHGVGCFLNVHEDAANLSPRGKDKLEPGMLLSNEPGLYLEGKYGIRIENLLLVQKTGEQDILGRDILCFETVTLAPYDNDAIDFNLLNGAEMHWLQEYYTKIGQTLNME